MKKLCGLLLVVFVLSGCSETPRIDARDSEHFDQSLQAVIASLPESERKLFAEALVVLMVAELDADLPKMPGVLPGMMSLHDRTAEEVIDAARQLSEAKRQSRQQPDRQ